MSGQLIRVWSETWAEIWVKLQRASFAPEDLYIELIRQVIPVPRKPSPPEIPPIEAFNQAGELVDPQALQAFESYKSEMEFFSHARRQHEEALSGQNFVEYFKESLMRVVVELDAVKCIERAYDALNAFDESEKLKAKYRDLVINFIHKYNIRYHIRGECSLRPTISGLFETMLSEVRRASIADEHVMELFQEFEDAFCDLRIERTPVRFKTCLQKQYNLLEALGASCPGVDAETLGAMCDQIDWPHVTLKDVGKKLYGFGSSYPGLRHGGRKKSQLRALTMRDFVSVSLMLAAFTPYVASGLDAERCYMG